MTRRWTDRVPPAQDESRRTEQVVSSELAAEGLIATHIVGVSR